jgi:hypothetical protein
MKDAAATWALIIGIDSYDNFKGLTGAARDAAAAVTWLRHLGVPDAQILLHAAPCDAAKPELDALGLTCHGCTEPEIWASFVTLMNNRGSKLYVFLSGHGFCEPGGDRVFLTREASDKVTKNLGIDWYAKFLRGQDYTTQYLVMDGCLNVPYTGEVRSRFVAGAQSGVALPPPRGKSFRCSASPRRWAIGHSKTTDTGCSCTRCCKHSIPSTRTRSAWTLTTPAARCCLTSTGR